MVRVNNIANDAASDQIKAVPDAPSFASSIDLFKGDNSCSRGGSLPLGFDNNFSITGLDTGKGPGLKLVDNMPVLRFDSKGPGQNSVDMPVLRSDSKGFDDNMPVLQFRSDDIYRDLTISISPCDTGNAITDDIPGNGPPDLSIIDNFPTYGSSDNVITDDIPGRCAPPLELKMPDAPWAALDQELLFPDLPMWKGESGSGGGSRGSSGLGLPQGEGGRLDGYGEGSSSHGDRSIANRAPDEDIEPLADRPRGSVGYGDAPSDNTDTLPKLPLEGKSILELDPKINPRLGCALAVSGALHEIDPSFPITNNNKQLAQLLKQHGYEAVPQDGSIKGDSLNPGDVVIGQRPAGMPGHAAIYKGQGKIYENDSDTGTIIGDGNLDRFNDKMHDKAGRWNKNGFSDVTVYRKVPVVGMSNY